MTLPAELIADRGAAASDAEFFRSPAFLRAEGATHSILIGSPAAAAVPVIVREIAGTGRFDATTPYGYPGARLFGESPDPGEIDWSATGLVSLFVRDRALGPPAFSGATDRSPILLADPAEPRKSRMSDRQQLRKLEAAGYSARVATGPRSTEADRAGFRDAYEQTMVRTEAAQRYFFGAEYFDSVLSSDRTWLVLVNGPEGDVAAAGIAALSDDVLHYYLSGTRDEHLRAAPMKALVTRMIDLGEELGVPTNLGGGIRAGDGLEEFKRGFANREESYRTHEIVCDPAAYEELTVASGAAPGDFFPAYRAG